MSPQKAALVIMSYAAEAHAGLVSGGDIKAVDARIQDIHDLAHQIVRGLQEQPCESSESTGAQNG